MKQHDFFSVLVIGDKPDEQISKFDENIDVEPYILYQYKDRTKYKKLQIEVYKKYLKTIKNLRDRNVLIDKINSLKKMSDDDFYLSLSEIYYLDNNKNIISTDNPSGRWTTCEQNGEIYSKKLITKNGDFITSAIKSDIDWNVLHNYQADIDKYSRTWELCVENQQPETTNDINIVKNMQNIVGYFENFKDDTQYVKYNTSFFTNAVVVDGIWFDMDDYEPFDWVINFYDNYIKNLSGDKLITIYECTK